MEIKMKTLAAGPNGVMLAGKTYPVEDTFGKTLVDAGYAEEVIQPEPEKEEPKINFEEIKDVETFAELKADQQKAALEYFKIEGDDSNGEKRVSLFAAYLKE